MSSSLLELVSTKSLGSELTTDLSIRKIGKRANALHSIGYFSLGCIIACSLGILLTPGQHSWPKNTYDFALIVLIGIFGFVAQALLTFGLQREKAGRAGLASYMQVCAHKDWDG